MIGDKYNMDDVFLRDLTVCVLDTLEGKIKWTNRFTSGDVFVEVPFYYSLTGDERFLLDSFSDDIESCERMVELNTDLIPRGHITLTSMSIKSDEFANPNVWVRTIIENEQEIRKILAKCRAIPITINYDLEIRVESEIDVFKCTQALLNSLWLYKFMYFEYNFINIDAVMSMPDSNSIEIVREKNMSSDNTIKIKVSFTVDTYYPAFNIDKTFDNTTPSDYGSGMIDSNGHVLTGGYSDYFSQPPLDGALFPSGANVGGVSTKYPLGQKQHPYNFKDDSIVSATSSFVDSATNPLGEYSDADYFATKPKKTRWYVDILKSRERSTLKINNPNGKTPKK